MPRLPKALPKHARLLVESAIERHQAATEALIAFLDGADGDADDNQYDPADPPAGEGIDDNELDDCREDFEPPLGRLEHIYQGSGCPGGTDDLEATGPAFELVQDGAP